MKIILYVCIPLLLLLSGCEEINTVNPLYSKESYIKDYKEWINNIECPSENDKQEVNERFKKFSDVLYRKFEADLSDSERNEILELSGRYDAKMLECEAGKTWEKAKAWLKGFFGNK